MISKATLRLAIFTLITITIWTLYEFYAATKNDSKIDEYYSISNPINSEIDESILKGLNDKINY